MSNDSNDAMIQKAYQGTADLGVMINELKARREAIMENILAEDMRKVIPELAMIKVQLEVISGVHRGHENRKRAFMAGMKSAAH